jgi:hypothetical protein
MPSIVRASEKPASPTTIVDARHLFAAKQVQTRILRNTGVLYPLKTCAVIAALPQQ